MVKRAHWYGLVLYITEVVLVSAQDHETQRGQWWEHYIGPLTPEPGMGGKGGLQFPPIGW